MKQLIQFGASPSEQSSSQAQRRSMVLWLQSITLAWMLVELAVSVWAAATAHSPALLAFGSDSLVEVLSAAVVLLQWVPGIRLSEARAARMAGALLYVLAFAVAAVAVASLALHVHPESSRAGLLITGAALVAMPALAWLKRREAYRSRNAALAADAVQSATCAYIACTTFLGLAANAALHVPWLDPLAALVAIPFLIQEGRAARRGHVCGCC